MPFAEFIKYLFISSAATIAGFFLLDLIIPLRSHIDILWWSLGAYIVLALLIHFLVAISLAKTNGSNIIGLVIFNVFLKLVFTFGFVTLYVKIYAPTDKYFLVPLLLTYFVFTVFETWFLNIQARGVR